MSHLAGFPGLFMKELQELAREKRLGAVLFLLGVALSIPFSFMATHGVGVYFSYAQALLPVVYVGPIVLVVVALTFAADAVSKERDSGTLGLVLSCPVTPGGVFLAKVAGVLVPYAATALFVLAFFAALAPTAGWVVVEAALWIILVPFLALYAFLAGVCLLLSARLGSSKTSVGASLAVLLPVFFLMQEPPGLGFLFRERAPALWAALEFNPFGMAITTAEAVVYGQAFWWGPVAFSAAAGALLLAGAYATLRRQEVAE